jgi:hypothetical protein
VSVKSLAAGLAAVAALGATAAGVTSLASISPGDAQVQPVVFGAPSPASGRYPQPLDPAANVPTPGELISLLNALQNPSVPFASKGNLVEGGVGGAEGRIADQELQKAARNGSLPLTFNVTNIAPGGPDAASADVTATGPSLPPTTRWVTFVNQGGWKLSRGSAMALLQAVQAG